MRSRNLEIKAHADAAKTYLTKSLRYAAGVIADVRSVDDSVQIKNSTRERRRRATKRTAGLLAHGSFKYPSAYVPGFLPGEDKLHPYSPVRRSL